MGHVARMRDTRHAYRIPAGWSERKTPFRRASRRWEDNIRIGIK